MLLSRKNVQEKSNQENVFHNEYNSKKQSNKFRMVAATFLFALLTIAFISMFHYHFSTEKVRHYVPKVIIIDSEESFDEYVDGVSDKDYVDSEAYVDSQSETKTFKNINPERPIFNQNEFENARRAMQNRLTDFRDGKPIGYVRVPKFRSNKMKTSDDGKLHIIFSSGCNLFQHWQSELLLASAWLVGQRGRITRLVSGCYDKQAETVDHMHQTFPQGKNDKLVPVEELNRSVNEEFGLYITPAFDGAIDFPWINKPSSINYFLKHARPELNRVGETIIVILDPDFIFLKQLSQVGSAPSDIIVSRGIDDGVNYPLDVVIKGRPVAQRYGLEGAWVSKFNVEKITGDVNSNALKYKSWVAAKHFSVGPPLMLHVDDAEKLSSLWVEFMPRVLKQETDILADMWAYCIAAAHIDLHHTILDHYMISNWGSDGQAYSWIDTWSTMSCLNPKVPIGAKMPHFIHLASNFKAPESREWMFHKGHVPADILSCDTPLIKESPDNVWEISRAKNIKQSAWVLCNTISRLNRVLMLYKKKFCPNGFESRKLVRLIQDKTDDLFCNERKDKWCWPLCQIEDLPSNWRDTLS